MEGDPEGAPDASGSPSTLPAGSLDALAPPQSSRVICPATRDLSGVPVAQSSTMAEASNSSEVQFDRGAGKGWGGGGGRRRAMPDEMGASAIVEVCATGTPVDHP